MTPPPDDDPPDDAIDPDLLAAADRDHAFQEEAGRTICLFCGTERRGDGRARRYRASDDVTWSPFPPECNGDLFS
jgi:hypothetical protein